MGELLFCYGTLRVPRLLAAVIGRPARPLPATLAGYRLARLRGRPYPGIWPNPAEQVSGCCYRLVHRRELRRADRYEGREYRRVRVAVSTADDDRLRAWAYLPRPGRARRDGAWRLAAFRRRALPRYLRQVAAWRAGGVAARAAAGA